MTDATLPILALTPGDCTGIGPELVAKILHDRRMAGVARLVAVGDARVFELGMRQADTPFSYRRIASPAEADWSAPEVPLVDLRNIDPAQFPPGKVSSESGRLTGDTLAQTIDFAKRGEIDGITFAPLNKRAMFDGGWRFPDEHKMFAHLLGHRGGFSEMNVLKNQWMSRVTSHVSLRQALDLITGPAIEAAIELADATMRRAGIAKPRLAVAALNPHGGENGLFGREEIEMIRPAVEAMAARGFDCRGPFPADTVYVRAFAGEFDGVLAMYHDQGQIATKVHGFNKGVTITAGLETVFTTPAHGTAFDIVGKGVATTGATESAIRLAARIAAARMQEAQAA
ncbi:4-hydroxythreonine-4-phosphate dehydrogenase PdxA [Bradyrhizobium sp. U87765 SZCCT0131]|uniref:PdxA family dehydrogenase n=1 Tax=unclassified Bradyrhizobium TaxID=2631580 RepID=UPI001BA62F7E|nr:MULTISPECIES: 4-hydroxythreonine-4-phosphate dehydrogenase PdxA [unclassified Bradyrhizobium]MBR1221990.1 4-hydroxythreonine-4-phosphate dehydrogenase PdxA [Bradyrhizobium sp. U87765 SZCCT0131]MBR1263812.1 4-hydroxythreonine-4-phosphate dehydrogenase PdxA [Bradyrhizobium sp. U87765 SZCCT0134]MBR1302618.1 4-hydroxythreonine-4-phosphate dehydrogenase PdxA [Bradyrhizobium sp. U87765 SZCCT0110]MBR1320062.1 4-hydroxythreonine-4-phosphate dehydrogenase PdxA [Bradyrhizobium sp. U87765 SZCCT0109]MB